MNIRHLELIGCRLLAESGLGLALAGFLIRLRKCLNRRWPFFRRGSANPWHDNNTETNHQAKKVSIYFLPLGVSLPKTLGPTRLTLSSFSRISAVLQKFIAPMMLHGGQLWHLYKSAMTGGLVLGVLISMMTWRFILESGLVMAKLKSSDALLHHRPNLFRV